MRKCGIHAEYIYTYLKLASLRINTSTKSAGNPVIYLAQNLVIKEERATTILRIVSTLLVSRKDPRRSATVICSQVPAGIHS